MRYQDQAGANPLLFQTAPRMSSTSTGGSGRACERGGMVSSGSIGPRGQAGRGVAPPVPPRKANPRTRPQAADRSPPGAGYRQEAQVEGSPDQRRLRRIVVPAREVHLEVRVERCQGVSLGRPDAVRRLPALVKPAAEVRAVAAVVDKELFHAPRIGQDALPTTVR